MVSVYWIRHQDHSDIFSQGYVGISAKPKQRWNHHFSKPTNIHMKNAMQKYGWENLVKEVVLIADNDYCVDIEKKLRPADFIGWNAVAGGGMPPKAKKGMGKGHIVSEETRNKLRIASTGKTISMEAREKIRQKSLAQWARYRANGNQHTPLPAENA